MRLGIAMSRRSSTSVALAAAASQRPWSSSERARHPVMYSEPRVEVVLGAIRDPGIEVGVAALVAAPDRDGARAEVRVGPGDVFLQAGFQRKLEAALELGPACLHALLELGCAHVVERMDDDLRLPQALGERDRALAPCARPRLVAGQHPQLRQVAVGHRELTAGR